MKLSTWERSWTILCAMYPQPGLLRPPEAMEGYWALLEPYYDHEVQRAVKEHLEHSKWFPAVTELIERMALHRRHMGNDWETVKSKLELEAEGKPVPAIVEGPDKSAEVLKTIPGIDRIGRGS